MSTHRIMRQSLHLFPDRMLTLKPLNSAEVKAGETFANSILQQLYAAKNNVEHLVLRLIVYSIDGFVNIQKWRI